MKREIVTFDNDRKGILSKVAKPVPENENCRALIEYMHEAMGYPQGIGLAAPQVGEDKRIIVVNVPHMRRGKPVGGTQKYSLINPVITFTKGKVMGLEGCLSFPGQQLYVPRHQRIQVTGFNMRWERLTISAKDLLARVIQHEIDHLNGVTLADYADLEINENLRSLDPASTVDDLGDIR